MSSSFNSPTCSLPKALPLLLINTSGSKSVGIPAINFEIESLIVTSKKS